MIWVMGHENGGVDEIPFYNGLFCCSLVHFTASITQIELRLTTV